MTPEPSQRDDALQRDAVLTGRAARVEEGLVDLLDVDAAILHGFDAARDLDQLAGCCCGSDSGWSRRIPDKRKRPRWTRPKPSAC